MGQTESNSMHSNINKIQNSSNPLEEIARIYENTKSNENKVLLDDDLIAIEELDTILTQESLIGKLALEYQSGFDSSFYYIQLIINRIESDKLLCREIDTHKEMIVYLEYPWNQMEYKINHEINIILEKQTLNNNIIVSSNQNILIYEPNILMSFSSISDCLQCTKKAYLSKLNVYYRLFFLKRISKHLHFKRSNTSPVN